MKLFSILIVIFSCAMAATLAEAKTSIVIVQGLAGEDYYQRHFDEQAENLLSAANKISNDDDVYVFNAGQGDALKENVLGTLDGIIKSATSDDQILVYLLGHGSFDGRDYKFNIVGGDVTGSELIDVLTQENSAALLALINTSSSSGALLKLFEDSRVHLLTATKSGAERTATRFGRHFAQGLQLSEADINKNQSISLQEAFNFAERETQAFYDDEGLLATENPRLQIPAGLASAEQIKVANLELRQSVTIGSEVANLYEQRDELDRQIDTLRLRRINMTDDEYLQRFQNLMIELSVLQSQIESELESDETENGA